MIQTIPLSKPSTVKGRNGNFTPSELQIYTTHFFIYEPNGARAATSPQVAIIAPPGRGGKLSHYLAGLTPTDALALAHAIIHAVDTIEEESSQ